METDLLESFRISIVRAERRMTNTKKQLEVCGGGTHL